MFHSPTSTWGLFPFESLGPHVIDDSSSADSPARNKHNGETNISWGFYPSFDGFAWASSPGIPVLRNIALDNNLAVLNNAIYNAGGWSVSHMQ